MNIRTLLGVSAVVLAGIVMTRYDGWDVEVPPAWKTLVRTKGQYYPIPAYWISTPEGRIAHDLVLPDAVPKPVPFDFDKADGPWFWHKSKWEVAKAYFKHLCSTEAGEWVFERPKDVEGVYFARPRNAPSDKFLGDVYGPEAPFVEKEFQLMGEGLRARGGQFVSPPFRNFSFVEEPRRSVKWQFEIEQPYIRVFGYTTIRVRDSFSPVTYFDELTPMQVRGIDVPTAKYAYSWRGIVRTRDREHQIAGSELIIYERNSKRIIAVSRNFQLTQRNNANGRTATWLNSPYCNQGRGPVGMFLSEFPQAVLMERKY